MDGYRSGRALAIAAIVLVAIQVALDAFGALGFLALRLGSPAGLSIVTSFGTGLAAILSPLLYVTTLVVFMVWVYRAAANLAALGSMNLRFTPSSAVWSFFIPIVNIVQPHQVMSAIWIESQPAVINEHGYALRRRATPVSIWWAAIVIGTILTQVLRLDLPDLASATESSESLQSLVTLGMVESAIWSIAGSLFMYMVWRAQGRQDAQWRDLELRRAVPRPTADVLR
jgi:hypothetical protein